MPNTIRQFRINRDKSLLCTNMLAARKASHKHRFQKMKQSMRSAVKELHTQNSFIFSAREKEARELCDLSVEAAADLIGIREDTIRRWEDTNAGCTVTTLIRVANAYETTPNWLLGFED